MQKFCNHCLIKYHETGHAIRQAINADLTNWLFRRKTMAETEDP